MRPDGWPACMSGGKDGDPGVNRKTLSLAHGVQNMSGLLTPGPATRGRHDAGTGASQDVEQKRNRLSQPRTTRPI